MRKLIPLDGMTFGQLTVLHRLNDTLPVRWVCRCSCGNTASFISAALRYGQATHCGCANERRKCPICAAEFVVSPQSLKKFCSRSCLDVDRARRVQERRRARTGTITCAVCHTPFTRIGRGCRRDYCSAACQKQARSAQRLLVMEAKSRPCEDCGQSYPFYVMDLHHRDGTHKQFMLADVDRRTFREVEDELAKCVTLCANCHRERHHGKEHTLSELGIALEDAPLAH